MLDKMDVDLDIEWVALPLLRFTMGTDDPAAPEDERPSRQVSVGSLAVSATPITIAQWQVFAEATGYRTTAETEGSSFRSAADPGEPRLGVDWTTSAAAAVTHISWFDAREFCRWSGTRLPTEAEAARIALEAPNPSGLWTWCEDWYDPTFHRDEQRVNPTGPISGTTRVARGGSDRPTARLGVLPDLSASDLGFRVLDQR